MPDNIRPCPMCGQPVKAFDSWLDYCNCADQKEGYSNVRVFEFEHCGTTWIDLGIEQI